MDKQPTILDLKYPAETITYEDGPVMVPGDVAFFYEYASFSYDPPRETPDMGKLRCAFMLANAERTAARKGWTATWEIDQDAETEPGENYFVSGAAHYQAVLHDEKGTVLAALGSIDLGFDDDGVSPRPPGDDPYTRVVAAELALEGEDQAVRDNAERVLRKAIAREIERGK